MKEDNTPHAQMLDPNTTALVVVDLQAKLMPAVEDAEQVLRNTQLLLRLAQVLELPTILTSQYPKGLGRIVPEITECAAGVEPIEKTSFGCFGEPGFLQQLKQRAPKATCLLLAGVESHICVAQTALGALQAGYVVHVAADAVSSRSASNRDIGLQRMGRAGVVVSSTEMMVYELLGTSSRPEFKAMLPYLK